MPRASAEAAAQTARDVLAAAMELFDTDGYAAVSVDDIASAAGVTRGAVYHHYRNKEGLFRAVAAQLQGQVAATVVAAAEAAGSDPQARLRAGCHAFLDAITGRPASRILLVDGPAALGWAQWRELDAAHSMVHLREGLRASGVDEALLDAATVQLSGAMNEAALWVTENPRTRQARRRAHEVLDRLLDAPLS